MNAARYEDLLAVIESLCPTNDAAERDVRWATQAGVVGVARAHDGKIEIFLRGGPLIAVSGTIREVLEHQTWFRRAGLPAVEASRLLLPAAGHFDQIAAFLCTELLRNGADSDLAAAFRRTESIIELAIRRLRLSDQVLIGLAGELLLLDAICQRANSNQVGTVVSGWDGWKESGRDFALGGIGVEVKATTRPTSTHKVQGVHQVERFDGEDGGDREDMMFLVSIGLIWENREEAFSVPSLVDSILRRLDDVGTRDAVETFLTHVREYGAASDVGYDHKTMSTDLRFTRTFVPRFVRGYDMTDTQIEVLRSRDIVPHRHVASASVTFRIELPDRVSGDLNPIWGLHEVAAAILDAVP